MTIAPRYYILSADAKSLSEAEEVYRKFNDKYLLKYEGERTASNYEDDLPEDYLDYLYNSRIIYISPELDVLERYYFLAKDSEWRIGAWDTLYTLIENGEVAREEVLKDISIGQFWEIKSLYKLENIDTNYQLPSGYHNNYHNVYNVKSWVFRKAVTDYYEEGKGPASHFNIKGNIAYTCDFIYNVYSRDHQSLQYVVETNYHTITNLSDVAREEYTTSILWHDGIRQLVSFAKCTYYENSFDRLYTESLYLLELDSGELTLIEDYAYYPILSPDGKYLAYTAPDELITDANDDPNNLMTDGIYVKNLENGTTTYFPEFDEYTSHYLIGWVNVETLMNEITK